MQFTRKLVAASYGLLLMVGGSSAMVAQGATGVGAAPKAPVAPPVAESYVSFAAPCHLTDVGLSRFAANIGVRGVCGVDPNAVAVSADFTVSGAGAAGWLKAYGANTPPPTVHVVEYSTGVSLVNNTDVTLCFTACAPGADMTLVAHAYGPGAAGRVGIDINGYYLAAVSAAADVAQLKKDVAGLRTDVGNPDTSAKGSLDKRTTDLENAVGIPYAPTAKPLSARVAKLEAAPTPSTPARIMNSRVNADGTIVGGDAVPNSVDPMTMVGSVEHVKNGGIYRIQFPPPTIEICTFQATSRDTQAVALVPSAPGTQKIIVVTTDLSGKNSDAPFNLTGTCTS